MARMIRFVTVFLVVVPVLAVLPAAGRSQDEPRLRRPVALELSPDEQWLYVANARSGSLTMVDLRQQRPVAEYRVGQRLSDLAYAQGSRFLATDELAGELLLLDVQGPQLNVTQRLPVSPYPVSVRVTKDGSRAFVASLWSRRLTVVELPEGDSRDARVVRTLDLPFAPRQQLLVDAESRLIVADSFRARLGIVDTRQGELLATKDFPGHNVRGMGLSVEGRMLVLSHQMLNELAHTISNDVHWGLLMSNDLRWLKLDAVLGDQVDLYAGAHMHPLGEAGSATADPGRLAVASDGTVVVTLSGVNEVAVGRENDFSLYRIPVGKRPTAVAISRDVRYAYVANTFGDSVSVVNLIDRETAAEISLGPQSPLSLVDAGELLFYDASLSHDGWMTCNSCHPDGHTNSMLNDNFSDRSFGAPKRVLSLLGRADTAPFAWNASSEKLEDQIRKSIANTMQAPADPTDQQVAALAAFVRSLETPPSLDKLRGVEDPGAVARGRALFAARTCTRCHKPPTYTSPDTYDVGLEDKLGNTRFNPPSLLGVGQRGPYFHDNRAETLESVFSEYGHQLEEDLGGDELSDLLAFLRSL